VDKLEVANLIKSYILSFEEVKCEDDDGFLDLYIHEKAKPGGLIHLNNENDYTNKTLFSYENYENYHIFFMNTAGGVNNLFKIVDMATQQSSKSALTYHERILSNLKFVQSYCASLEKAIPTKYKLLKDERLDRFRIDLDDTSGHFVVSHTTAFFAYHYPSVYVTFVFDKNHNLINIGFEDSHVKEVMKDLSIEKKAKAFDFFIDYFIEKGFRELVNIDYKEVNVDNLDDYLLLHAMKEV